MKPPAIPGVGFYKHDDGKGARFYRVRLGKRFTGGEPREQSFKTLKKAVEWAEEEENSKKKHGESLYELSAKQLAEARDALNRLKDRGTLGEAVDYYLKHAPHTGKKAFKEVSKEFLTSRRGMGCKKTTMANYDSSVGILNEHWGEVNMSEFNVPDIEDWIAESEWSPRTRKNYLITLTTVFNFALKREYCLTNPPERVDRPILDDKPPGILTVEQACQLLTRSMKESPEMIDGLAIGLFAGLRRSELCLLDWSEVDLEARTIEVKASKAKTRKRRLVTITDNLAEWLARKPQKAGPVVYDLKNSERLALSVDAFGEKLKILVRGRQKSDEDDGAPPIVTEWPHNAIRHSFGSYFYGKSKNESLTAAEMGNSPEVVIKCYRELVKPKAADDYWSIVPASGIAKIILPEKKKKAP